jgi:cyclophilin family peptidyl-prolyl cis-trans isomerase
MATEKRARKKQARDNVAAQRAAEFRRRRNSRLAGIGLVSLAVVGFALFSGSGDDEPSDPASGAGATAGPDASEDPLTVACDAEAPPEANPQQYDSPPRLDLPKNLDLKAIITTSCGDIELDLLEDKAPESVVNFVFLARDGFYDGLIWHRVESNAVIQTGDPNGQNGVEPDGPGYSIADEFPAKAQDYVYGVVGMANAGPGTTGSQFFIVVHDRDGGCNAKGEPLGKNADASQAVPCPAGYQPLYNIFGEVSESSYDTLDRIAALETRGGTDPVEAVKPIDTVFIESIEILEN